MFSEIYVRFLTDETVFIAIRANEFPSTFLTVIRIDFVAVEVARR